MDIQKMLLHLEPDSIVMSSLLLTLSSTQSDPGLSAARALRSGLPDLSLTALSRAPHGAAVHADVFDAVWTVPSWTDLDPVLHAEAIAARLAPDGAFLPTSPAEAHWAANALAPHDRVLAPPPSTLAQTSGLAPESPLELPLSTPATISITAPVEDLHAFGRRHDWRLWMRAPLGARQPLGHWTEFDEIRSRVAEQAHDPEALYLQRQVEGTSLTLPFAAHTGKLLGAALVRPAQHRATYHVGPVPDALRNALADTLDALSWTGGGSLNLIEDDDGTRWLDAWQPCFGPVVEGIAHCGVNLPAQLVAAGRDRRVAAPSTSPNTFSRVTTCTAGRHAPTGPAPEPLFTSPPLPSSTLSASPAPEATLNDELRAVIDDLPTDWDTSETPRSVLLPARTSARFAAFTDAADRIEDAFSLDATRVGLSIKTNPADCLLASARNTGMLAETIHPDEMAHARRHGYTTDEMIVNGPVQALLSDLDTAPYALFGDALRDLESLPFDPSQSIIGVRTRPPERGPSRFGVDLSEPERMDRLCDRLTALPDTKIGLHLHAPSSTLGHNRWWACVRRVLQWAATIQERTGRPVECLDLGGGWHPDDWLDVFVPGLIDRREPLLATLPKLNTLLFEPGKALSQPLGVVLSRVIDARPSREDVILDASIAELSNVDYHAHRLLAYTDDRGWHRLPRGEGRLLGRLCMEADVLGRRRRVDHLSPGDTVVVCDAGAYDASMTYPFGRGTTAS